MATRAGRWDYRIRVLDTAANPNNVITEDLPHPKGTTYQIRGFQGGFNAPQAQIGRATIPLYAPGSGEHRMAASKYSQLGYLQRVEIYPATGQGQANPLWSGVIRRLPTARDKFSIEAEDSLTTLSMAQRFDTFQTAETADVLIRKYGVNYFGPLLVDSLATRGNWTTTGAWQSTTQDGLACQKVALTSPNTPASLLSTGTYATQNLTTGAILLDFTMQVSASASGNASSVWVSIESGGGLLVGLLVLQPSAASQTVFGYVQVQKQGGTVFNAPVFPIGATDANGVCLIRGQLVLTTRGVDSGGNVPFEVLVMGGSVGAVSSGTGAPYVLPSSAFLTGGQVKVGAEAFGTDTSTVVTVRNLALLTQQQLMALPSVLPTPAMTQSPPTHQFSQATCLNILNAACNQEGWTMRKTPKPGWFNDLLEFG